jgi:hypothetical protein
MEVTLTKPYNLNGNIKPAGMVLEVTKEFAAVLASGGFLSTEKGKQPKLRRAVIDKTTKLNINHKNK